MSEAMWDGKWVYVGLEVRRTWSMTEMQYGRYGQGNRGVQFARLIGRVYSSKRMISRASVNFFPTCIHACLPSHHTLTSAVAWHMMHLTHTLASHDETLAKLN